MSQNFILNSDQLKKLADLVVDRLASLVKKELLEDVSKSIADDLSNYLEYSKVRGMALHKKIDATDARLDAQAIGLENAYKELMRAINNMDVMNAPERHGETDSPTPQG